MNGPSVIVPIRTHRSIWIRVMCGDISFQALDLLNHDVSANADQVFPNHRSVVRGFALDQLCELANQPARQREFCDADEGPGADWLVVIGA